MFRKQKRITRRLVETENKYRELVREDRILIVGQMTASLSHELNQPLTAILSTAQAGLRFTNADNRDPELLKEIFHNIIEDDKRAAAIISSVRGMMKLEERDKEKLNLNSLIQEAVAICSSEAVVQRINLHVTLPEYPVNVIADRTQIQQVILNLISNAQQSMSKINMKNNSIDIEESILGDTVTVSIRDYGEGISSAVKDNLFKPFVTSKEEGIGIGLAISRSIIEGHKGKIWAENMPTGGAKFSFSLNIYKNE